MTDDTSALDNADGILRARSWHTMDGERVPWIVYRVIVDGIQVGTWVKRRSARADLRRRLRYRDRGLKP